MLDKVLSVKLAGGLMTVWMALHILIMSQADGESVLWMVAFFVMTLVAASTFRMDEDSSRKVLLALGVGWLPACIFFTYGFVADASTDDLPPAPAMIFWWGITLQSLLVGLNVGTSSE
tara:strand:- start:153 stop:506 length:354 start_codon:yes stop_codon:yes gene_type:complete